MTYDYTNMPSRHPAGSFAWLSDKLLDDQVPSPDELALVVAQNVGQPLPWYVQICVIKQLRGAFKSPRGRKPYDHGTEAPWVLALWRYERYLAEEQLSGARPASLNLEGSHTGVRESAHERAAQRVIDELVENEKIDGTITIETFMNAVSKARSQPHKPSLWQQIQLEWSALLVNGAAR